MMTVIIIVPADIFSTKVAVLGANSPEWFSCAVGAVMAGGLVRVTIVMSLSIVIIKPLKLLFFITCLTKLTR